MYYCVNRKFSVNSIGIVLEFHTVKTILSYFSVI